MKYDKYFLFKFDFTSYAVIIILTYVHVPSIKLCLSTQIQCTKNVNAKKFPLNTHQYCLVWVFIYFFFQGDDTTFYIQNMNVLNEKPSLSHRPHWFLLSLLFTHVSMMYICLWYYRINSTYLSYTLFFNRYFMSKEIHKKESRLRLLQNNDLSTQMVSFVTEIKLLFHYCIVLDILYCLLSRIRF